MNIAMPTIHLYVFVGTSLLDEYNKITEQVVTVVCGY